MHGLFKKQDADKGGTCGPDTRPHRISRTQGQNLGCPVQEIHTEAHTNKKAKQPKKGSIAAAFFCFCQAGSKPYFKKTGDD